MPVRFVNTTTDRVVEYATPEELAPPRKTYLTKDEKAEAERVAARRKRLLDTLRQSKRWQPTSREVTRQTERQREHARREAERRRLEAELRAEYEQRLENERAKWERGQGSDPEPEQILRDAVRADPARQTPSMGTQPSTAEVRAWAREQGYEVPTRGNVGREVWDAYQAAHTESSES